MLFLILSLVEIIFLGKIYSERSAAEKLLLDTIFLNSPHVVLTFVMLFNLPTLKQWCIEFYSNSKQSIVYKSAKIYAVILIIHFIVFIYCELNSLIFRTTLLLYTIATIYHALRQISGISQMYEYSVGPKTQISENRQNEKKLFKYFIITIILYQIQRIVFGHINQEYIGQIDKSFQIIVFLFAGAIIVNAFGYPKEYIYNKIFLIRVMLYPLSPYSYLAVLGRQAEHGISYGFVFAKMTNFFKNYKRSKILLATLLFSLLAIFASMSMALVRGSVMFHFPPWSIVLFKFFGANSIALSYMHYYFDASIFKMGHDSSRKHIAPLFKCD